MTPYFRGTDSRVELDPIRFRVNLYSSGLPAWREFAMVGKTIRVGDVKREVPRPTDRWKATSSISGDDKRSFTLVSAGVGIAPVLTALTGSRRRGR